MAQPLPAATQVAIDEQLDSLTTVLSLIRAGTARSRPELSRHSGLGRTVIAQRVAQLLAAGLVEQPTLGPSTGGRAPRELRFCANAGQLLTAELGATSISVGLCDLAGEVLTSSEEPADIAAGPEKVLNRVEELFDELLASRPAGSPPVWGVGIGIPAPVEYARGRPIAPPIMPGWDNYPVRDRLADRYNVPTWVDNEVNLMALGELRVGLAKGEHDIVFIKIGTGIGAGLISGGRLHRGAQGVAGDIGHIAIVDDATIVCRCGNIGCLEAIAGGAALGWQATAAANDGRSRYLSEHTKPGTQLTAKDVAAAANHGDPFCVELLTRTGQLIGRAVAALVNFYNPSLIIIGGGVAGAGDSVLAAIRQTVYRRSLPLATRELRIARTSLGDKAGLYGAAFVVLDELFSRERLGRWLEHGSPAGFPELARNQPAA